MPGIHVVIATLGRAALVRRTVALLGAQTRAPDGIVVAATCPQDVSGLERGGRLRVVFSEPGSCRQRNRALDLLEGQADTLVFFDDDFVPAADYLAAVEALFAADAGLVGITGELRADGVRDGELTIEQALALLSRPWADPPPLRARHELYGCNMAVRARAAAGLRFDENLPLYGWQEDIDFTSRLGRRGRQVSTGAITGVHLGASGGRTSGKRLGYSQVANVLYLRRKGTMRAALGHRLLFGNLAANALRSLRPEPAIDRRGRLLGNLIALADWLRGRVDPRRILGL
ncbi:glycosyltransferase family 2 protein [Novosphingobium soli]|uniref:Glycosyltransferase family 2 protein n=1 Tax=Novosphingobium soli TaxID=574956 RepID=A0ABV6CXZ9_9SPHN